MGLDEDAQSTESAALLNAEPIKKKSRWMPLCWYFDCVPFIKARYVLAFMLFLGLCNVYALRVNLSVAIVQMTADNPHHGQRYNNFKVKGQLVYWLVLGALIGQIQNKVCICISICIERLHIHSNRKWCWWHTPAAIFCTRLKWNTSSWVTHKLNKWGIHVKVTGKTHLEMMGGVGNPYSIPKGSDSGSP